MISRLDLLKVLSSSCSGLRGIGDVREAESRGKTYPQKMRLNEYSREAMLTPKGASGRAVMMSCEKVEEKIMKDQVNRNTSPERLGSSPAGAFRYDPIGQYQVRNKSAAMTVCHGSSAIVLERTNTGQEYILDGFSRAS